MGLETFFLALQAACGNPDFERLRTEVFPRHPRLFYRLAKHCGEGIPKAYRRQRKHPVDQKRVFFESNLGKQYTGNPRYIYERMLETHPDYRYTWCYEGKAKIPGNPLIVKRESEEYYQLLAASRYLVNNTTFSLWFHRPESFYLQTWHGTPYKLMHWDRVGRPLAKRTTPAFYVKSRGWDVLLSPNRHSTSVFRSAFRYKGEILESGYPANDIFYDETRYWAVRGRMRALLGIPEMAPVYLYAPTYRDGGHLGSQMFKFDLLLDVDDFLAHAPDGAVLLVRAHHMSAADAALAELPERVIDVSHFDDATELMCAADVLVTDYSSIVFDWACSRKPVIYWVPDIDLYTGTLRGAYFDLDEVNCGPVCRTPAELHAALAADPVPYHDFYTAFCAFHDGTSTDQAIAYLLSPE
ncbi:MAG: CDP-glycerol glycerophosphotransferase family protein [Propionibacteriaceae bacterium]|jgi:CDP-glycerol glycerophosphotransferase|nr:CDP-glycerol glycerophosphotransferase family protein [Propionibacteriaceae bacterium]